MSSELKVQGGATFNGKAPDKTGAGTKNTKNHGGHNVNQGEFFVFVVLCVLCDLFSKSILYGFPPNYATRGPMKYSIFARDRLNTYNY